MAEYESDFVAWSWMRAQRVSFAKVPGKAYFPWMRTLIANTLKHAHVFVDTVDGAARGFVVVERLGDALIVHMLYVRHDLRRQGVALGLLAHAAQEMGGEQLVCTCRVRDQYKKKATAMGFQRVTLHAIETARMHGRDVA